MRVLAISTLFPTPEMPNHGIFVYNRLAAMAEQHDVTVVNPIPSSIVHRLMPRYRQQQSAPIIREDDWLGTIYHPRYTAIPGFMKAQEHESLLAQVSALAEKMHAKHPFDHIDVHWTYPDLPFGLELARKWGVPCTVTLRGMEAFYLDDTDNRKRLIANALSQVDGIISLSQEMADQADSVANTASKTTIITNGVDTEAFTFIPKDQARLKLEIPDDETVLLGVGSLIRRKGFHHIVNAMTHLRKSYPERKFTYYILGGTGLEGDFEAQLRNLILQSGLTDVPGNRHKVVLKGKVNNARLPLWYNAADLFCLSSFGEGSPNVLSEALSCGCPAITSKVGAAPDIMRRDATAQEDSLGLIVPNQEHATDADAGVVWAEAVRTLIDEPRHRQSQAESLSKYTWQWCAQNVDKALRAFRRESQQ